MMNQCIPRGLVPRFVSVLWRKCEVEYGSLRPCFSKGQVAAHGLGKLARNDEAKACSALTGRRGEAATAYRQRIGSIPHTDSVLAA